MVAKGGFAEVGGERDVERISTKAMRDSWMGMRA